MRSGWIPTLAAITLLAAAGGAFAGHVTEVDPATVPTGFVGSHNSGTPPWALSLATRIPTLMRTGVRPFADFQWTEQVYTARTGDHVHVSVSVSYASAELIGQTWADFFAGLVHGSELQLLHAYIAPLPVVQAICGTRAVGCYGDDRLIVTNEPAAGFTPEEVARHEYGHHIAFNRLNPPWKAIDWGPKRWASSANVCARVRAGSAYPGDQFLLYHLNPGEAFAEAYRVLIDIKRGQSQPSWPLVDSSFFPDSAALAAIEQDVDSSWAGPTTRTFHGRFPAGNRSSWKLQLSSPLDGMLAVRLTAPAGVGSDLALIADGAVVVTGHPRSRGRTSLRYKICGQRSFVIRFGASNGSGRRFDLQVTAPEIADLRLSRGGTAGRRGPAPVARIGAGAASAQEIALVGLKAS